jgi:tryptophan 2,3-dioxygenase
LLCLSPQFQVIIPPSECCLEQLISGRLSRPFFAIAGEVMKARPKNYGEYLSLEKLMTCQEPMSGHYGREAHDETLFIIVHQVYELWFKQVLHELDSVVEMFRQNYVDEKNIGVAVSRLDRIVEIQKLLIAQIGVLETMSPLDFLDFRGSLGGYSGFQSFQFRLIEARLGLRRESRLQYSDRPYDIDLPESERMKLREAEQSPSLFDVVQSWLERTPFLEFGGFKFLDSYKLAAYKMLDQELKAIEATPDLSSEERNVRLKRVQDNEDHFLSILERARHDKLMDGGFRRFSYGATLAALLINLYRDQPILHSPYRLLATLGDIDEHFTLWRYRHTLMVHRMIGKKVGTGGSAGVDYLKATVEKHKVFSELYDMATLLIPRSDLPALPPEVERDLGFYFSTRKI